MMQELADNTSLYKHLLETYDYVYTRKATNSDGVGIFWKKDKFGCQGKWNVSFDKHPETNLYEKP